MPQQLSNTSIRVEPEFLQRLSNKSATVTRGSLLHKLEIVVHFFQVYCIIVWMTAQNNLVWPANWMDIKKGYDWPPYLLSVDVQGAYALQGIHVETLYREVRACKAVYGGWVVMCCDPCSTQGLASLSLFRLLLWHCTHSRQSCRCNTGTTFVGHGCARVVFISVCLRTKACVSFWNRQLVIAHASLVLLSTAYLAGVFSDYPRYVALSPRLLAC